MTKTFRYICRKQYNKPKVSCARTLTLGSPLPHQQQQLPKTPKIKKNIYIMIISRNKQRMIGRYRMFANIE